MRPLAQPALLLPPAARFASRAYGGETPACRTRAPPLTRLLPPCAPSQASLTPTSCWPSKPRLRTGTPCWRAGATPRMCAAGATCRAGPTTAPTRCARSASACGQYTHCADCMRRATCTGQQGPQLLSLPQPDRRAWAGWADPPAVRMGVPQQHHRAQTGQEPHPGPHPARLAAARRQGWGEHGPVHVLERPTAMTRRRCASRCGVLRAAGLAAAVVPTTWRVCLQLLLRTSAPTMQCRWPCSTPVQLPLITRRPKELIHE